MKKKKSTKCETVDHISVTLTFHLRCVSLFVERSALERQAAPEDKTAAAEQHSSDSVELREIKV